jgi:hypothetical protein
MKCRWPLLQKDLCGNCELAPLENSHFEKKYVIVFLHR